MDIISVARYIEQHPRGIEWKLVLPTNNLKYNTTRRYIMPRRDGTGPNSNGPNTGRGLGPCLNNSMRKRQSISVRLNGRYNNTNTGLGRFGRRNRNGNTER
jgi:hypothetical protein